MTRDERAKRAQEVRRTLFGERPARGGKTLPIEDDVSRVLGDFAFGDVWSRPGLEIKTRSLVTIAVLTALYRSDQIRIHVGAALDLGLTPEEILEVILHAGAYAGVPTSANARQVAHEVFEKRGIV